MIKAIKNPFVILILTVSVIILVAGNSDLFTKETEYSAGLDHSITLAEASKLTHNFRKNAPWDRIGGFFGKDAVTAILNQEGAIGLRYYYGLDEEGMPHIVLVGVNEAGNDMVEGLLAERSGTCPPFCVDENVLNSADKLKQLTSK